MRKEIAQLSVVCQNSVTGCEWTGLLKDYLVSFFLRGGRDIFTCFMLMACYFLSLPLIVIKK